MIDYGGGLIFPDAWACGPPDPPEPTAEDFDDEWECTHCGGEGVCMDGSDPLWDCPDTPHRCHACGGSGKREDQVCF